MTAARAGSLQQYRTPKGLLAHLSRNLQRCREAQTPDASLDAALDFACSAWSMTAWLWLPISKNLALRRQIVRAFDRSLPILDLDAFGAIVADRCPNLALCEAIAADPCKLAVSTDASGRWRLLLLEDGESELISLLRFEDVLTFWREFVQRYLADLPTIQRAA